MAEENENILDLEGAQSYLNNLLENQPETDKVEETDDKEELLSRKEADILRDSLNIDADEEQLEPKQVQKLIDFVGGDWKDRKPEELSDEELERLTKIVVVKAGHFNYRPKKTFDVKYKKKRQRKNKMAKKSRQLNRT